MALIEVLYKMRNIAIDDPVAWASVSQSVICQGEATVLIRQMAHLFNHCNSQKPGSNFVKP